VRIGVLRSYFTDRSPDLEGYMLARLGGPDVGAELSQMAAHTRGGVVVHPLVVGSSALLGTVSAFALWWAAEDAAPLLLTATGVVATGVAALSTTPQLGIQWDLESFQGGVGSRCARGVVWEREGGISE
jgi:hypothetical protein